MGFGDDVIAEGDVLGDVDLPAGMDQPHHHARDVVGKAREVRLGADRRERLPIDLGGVADVVEHSLTLSAGSPGVARDQHQRATRQLQRRGPLGEYPRSEDDGTDRREQ